MRLPSILLAGAALVGGLYALQRLRRPAPIALANKVVIVTGASSGIGYATAQAFAAAGARVVLAGRRAAQLQALEAEIKAQGGSALAVPTDIGVEAELERLVNTTQATFGPVDILINNAAYLNGGAFATQAPAALNEILRTNLHGTFRLTQLVLPAMLERRTGHIINVVSIGARIYIPGLALYSATKAAILSFSNVLRRELAGSGVHLTTVLPAGVRTPMVESALTVFEDKPEKASSPTLQMLAQQIATPAALGQELVKAARYHPREVVLGGPSVAAAIWLETLATPQVDAVLAHVDTDLMIKISSKLGGTA